MTEPLHIGVELNPELVELVLKGIAAATQGDQLGTFNVASEIVDRFSHHGLHFAAYGWAVAFLHVSGLRPECGDWSGDEMVTFSLEDVTGKPIEPEHVQRRGQLAATRFVTAVGNDDYDTAEAIFHSISSRRDAAQFLATLVGYLQAAASIQRRGQRS